MQPSCACCYEKPQATCRPQQETSWASPGFVHKPGAPAFSCLSSPRYVPHQGVAPFAVAQSAYNMNTHFDKRRYDGDPAYQIVSSQSQSTWSVSVGPNTSAQSAVSSGSSYPQVDATRKQHHNATERNRRRTINDLLTQLAGILGLKQPPEERNHRLSKYHILNCTAQELRRLLFASTAPEANRRAQEATVSTNRWTQMFEQVVGQLADQNKEPILCLVLAHPISGSVQQSQVVQIRGHQYAESQHQVSELLLEEHINLFFDRLAYWQRQADKLENFVCRMKNGTAFEFLLAGSDICENTINRQVLIARPLPSHLRCFRMRWRGCGLIIFAEAESLTRLTGWTSNELRDRPVTRLLPNNDHARLAQMQEQCVATNSGNNLGPVRGSLHVFLKRLSEDDNSSANFHMMFYVRLTLFTLPLAANQENNQLFEAEFQLP